MRINSGMVIFRCAAEKVDSRFLYHVLRSPLFARLIERFRSGSAQPQLPIRSLNEVEIPMPPIDKQKEIANIFDRLGLDIHACDRRFNEVQDMGRGLLNRCVSKGGVK